MRDDEIYILKTKINNFNTKIKEQEAKIMNQKDQIKQNYYNINKQNDSIEILKCKNSNYIKTIEDMNEEQKIIEANIENLREFFDIIININY